MSEHILYALTTKDNPYSPFSQFDDWYRFDIDHGYGTCAYLGRIILAKGLDENDESDINKAIDEIIKYDFRNIYKRVKE